MRRRTLRISCYVLFAFFGLATMFTTIKAGEAGPVASQIPEDAIAKSIVLENGHDPNSDEKTIEYLKKIEYFKNGVKVGERRWYLNGQLAEERIYKDGVLSGLARIWNDDGSLSCESEYKNGKREGKTTFYYQNGKIYQIFPFRNGKVHGIARSWSKNGIPQNLEECYFDGNRVGKYNIHGSSVSEAEYSKALSADHTLTPIQDD